MKKIERPYWHRLMKLEDGSMINSLEKWFDENCAGMYAIPAKDIEEGVVVYGQHNREHKIWCTEFTDAPFKALLINITELNKKSREEELEEVVTDMVLAGKLKAPCSNELIERAKAALERGE